VGINSHFRERAARLVLAESERPNGSKRPSMRFRDARLDVRAVATAVGVPKLEAGRNTTLDEELPTMHGAMVRGADHDQQVWTVISAFGAKSDVMNVDEYAVTTAWHDASAAVAPHHFTSHRRRNFLSRAP
jgi:hypothetical protein